MADQADVAIEIKKLSELDKEEIAAAIEKVLHSMSEFLGLNIAYDYSLETYERSGEAEINEEREYLKVKIQTEDNDSLLIGYHGQTLEKLQYLIQAGVSTYFGQRVRVVLHISDYRDKREDALINLAKRAEAQVLESGQDMELQPMRSDERRIVHQALQDGGKVKSESVGEGSERRIVVSALN